MELHLPVKTLLQSLNNIVFCNVDESFVVRRLSSLTNATQGDLAIVIDRGDASVFDAVSSDAIKKSSASVILMQQQPADDSKRYIVVKDALAAFEQLVRLFDLQVVSKYAPAVIDPSSQVAATAVVGVGATVGAGCSISDQAYIGKSCIIGNNVLLHPGAKILDRCIIGNNVIIQAGAVIGSDGFGYQVTRQGLRKIPHVGIVRIGSYVEIGANCMIDRAAFDETVLEDGVKLDNGVHIAHNVKIGAGTAIIAQTGIAGSTVIGRGCQIGGQVAIRDHLTIGNGVKIVSKSAVLSDLKDGEVVCGIPAIPFGQWKRLTVSLAKVPEMIRYFKGKQTGFTGATTSWWRRFFS